MSNDINKSERRVIAWIGKAVRVEGKVISEEDLTIDGDVEGSIELGGHSLMDFEWDVHKGQQNARKASYAEGFTLRL